MVNRYRWGWRAAHLLMVPLVLAWAYPFLWLLAAGFKTSGELLREPVSLIPSSPTLENFARAWEVAGFERYFLNTVIITVAVVFLEVLVNGMAGYALSRGSMPGKKVILATLVASMFLPAGYTIIPVFELVTSIGLNNTLAGIILAEAAPTSVIAVLLFMAYFSKVPRELEEAATVDGASFPRTFFTVMLPLAKPIIATITIMKFIAAWNSFLIPLVFSLGAPDLRTLGVGMYAFFGPNTTDWTGLAAAALISLTPVIVVFLILQRYFVEGMAGALKS